MSATCTMRARGILCWRPASIWLRNAGDTPSCRAISRRLMPLAWRNSRIVGPNAIPCMLVAPFAVGCKPSRQIGHECKLNDYVSQKRSYVFFAFFACGEWFVLSATCANTFASLRMCDTRTYSSGRCACSSSVAHTTQGKPASRRYFATVPPPIPMALGVLRRNDFIAWVMATATGAFAGVGGAGDSFCAIVISIFTLYLRSVSFTKTFIALITWSSLYAGRMRQSKYITSSPGMVLMLGTLDSFLVGSKVELEG